MSVKGKPFSQQLHDKFNEFGISIAKEFFGQYGFRLDKTTNKYGIDCSFYDRRDNLIKNVEIEVRHKEHWGEDGFKYSTLTIPCRKDKFVKESGLYISISELGHELFLVDFDVIAACPVIKKKNVYNSQEEEFYDVVLSKCKLIRKNKTNGLWEQVKNALFNS